MLYEVITGQLLIHLGMTALISFNSLASLENREVKSLPFTLQGSVRTLEDGILRFEQKGHLYPVPGKPGFFRSAVTQAEQLRHEKL